MTKLVIDRSQLRPGYLYLCGKSCVMGHYYRQVVGMEPAYLDGLMGLEGFLDVSRIHPRDLDTRLVTRLNDGCLFPVEIDESDRAGSRFQGEAELIRLFAAADIELSFTGEYE